MNESHGMGCCKCEEYQWGDSQPVFVAHTDGKEYCIFHAPAETKEDKHGAMLHAFEERLYRLGRTATEDAPCNFSGAIFAGPLVLSKDRWSYSKWPSVSFACALFCKKLSVLDVVFSGTLVFSGAVFVGEVYFRGVEFEKGAQFLFCHFDSGICFLDVSFVGWCGFSDSVFWGNSLFLKAIFRDASLFAGVSILGSLSLDMCSFEKARDTAVSFRGLTSGHLGKITIQNVNVYGELLLDDVVILGAISFDQCSFF